MHFQDPDLTANLPGLIPCLVPDSSFQERPPVPDQTAANSLTCVVPFYYITRHRRPSVWQWRLTGVELGL